MHEIHRLLPTTAVTTLAGYLDGGGGRGVDTARRLTPAEVIRLIEGSGLRGRGGAGFPTGKKWRTLATLEDAVDEPIPVVVNAAEGEPGTFKDRALLRLDPYSVIEGAAIAAHAIGSNEIIIAIKASFREETLRLMAAIDEINAADWMPGMTVRIVDGPSEYLFGEETALLEVIDGRPPLPRIAPPFRRGINESNANPGWGADGRRGDGPGGLVDNVETLANVSGILANGVDWFRELGTEASPGSIICTVTGSTPFHGVAEFPIGTTVRQVIDELGGGARSGHRITAVLNGVSNPPLTPDQLDTPLTYEDMSAIGSGLGSVSLIVVDDATSLTSVAAGVARFLAVESCGQCEPCKRDGLDLAESLSDTSADGAGLGDERIDERLDTVARGARCALAGQTERVVGRLVELARRTETHPTSASEPYLVAPVVEMTGRQAVLDTAHATKRFDWTYPEDGEFSSAWPVQRLADQPVEIKAPRTAESTSPSTELGETINSSAADAGSFQSVTDLGRQINDEVGALRRVAPEEREQLLHELRRDIERYERAMEGVVFPALERLDPDEGPEITWYPAQHTKAAKQIVADLDLGSTPLSSRLVDQLCASITVSIDEVEEGVLPRLRAELVDDQLEADAISTGVDQLIEP